MDREASELRLHRRTASTLVTGQSGGLVSSSSGGVNTQSSVSLMPMAAFPTHGSDSFQDVEAGGYNGSQHTLSPLSFSHYQHKSNLILLSVQYNIVLIL